MPTALRETVEMCKQWLGEASNASEVTRATQVDVPGGEPPRQHESVGDQPQSGDGVLPHVGPTEGQGKTGEEEILDGVVVNP